MAKGSGVHTLHKLAPKAIEAEIKRGDKKRLFDGGGLILSIAGGRSWIFSFTHAGKRREIGLGSYPDVTLAKARELAASARSEVRDGRAPLSPRARAKVNPTKTFGEFAEEFITEKGQTWRSDVHRKQWRQSLKDHASLLTDMQPSEITTEHVLSVLQPLWNVKSETASRLRGRIEQILNAAKVKGLITGHFENPARWKGHLELSLGKAKKLSRGHHAALPYEEAPAFMADLSKRTALSARLLEFIILTACRSGEALGATWGEIDLEKRLWIVPAERMKANKEHRVPLPTAAIAILEALKPPELKTADRVFAVNGAARSNMACAMLLRRMGRGDLTTHGFRSTFRDWAGDETGHAHQTIEAALAHTIQNKAEAAYRRRDALEKRRVLMDDWATYLSTGAKE